MQREPMRAAGQPLISEDLVSDETDKMVVTLKKVAAILANNEVRFALTGSFAAYARGGAPPEHDIDFLIHPGDVEAAATGLAAAGLRVEQVPEDWLIKVFDGDRMVDLIHRPIRRPVDDELLRDSDELCIGGAYLPVISATVLLTHKSGAFNAHACDFATALPLARALREQVDWKRVAAQVAGSPYARAFLYLLRELDIIDLPGLEE